MKMKNNFSSFFFRFLDYLFFEDLMTRAQSNHNRCTTRTTFIVFSKTVWRLEGYKHHWAGNACDQVTVTRTAMRKYAFEKGDEKNCSCYFGSHRNTAIFLSLLQQQHRDEETKYENKNKCSMFTFWRDWLGHKSCQIVYKNKLKFSSFSNVVKSKNHPIKHSASIAFVAFDL